MVASYLLRVLFFIAFSICTISAEGQEVKKLKYALETNAMSWLSGHGGPDLRFVILKGRWQWYAGLKVPFYHTYYIEGMSADQLLFHRQMFSHGIDPIIGFRATFGRFQIGSFIQYGKYYYNNSRTVCVGGTPVLNELGQETGYTRCEGVDINQFREITSRFGIGVEKLLRVYRKGNFSIHAGSSLQLNFITSKYEGFLNNSENGENGVHDTKPEIHRSFDKILLENIAMSHVMNVSPRFERIRVAPKFLIQIRYTL